MATIENIQPRPSHEQIDTVHKTIHDKAMYTISKTFTAVANDGFADIHLITPADYEAHIRASVNTEAKAYIKTYIGTTYTNPGTGYTPFNRVTDGGITLATALFSTTPNVLGALRVDEMVGSGIAANAVGGNSNSEFETVLAPASDWLIRVQNKGGTTKDITIEINYYLKKR